MKNKKIVNIALTLALTLFIVNMFFKVGEDESAIILTFGEPQAYTGKGEKIDPGWHVKIPFAQTVFKFNTHGQYTKAEAQSFKTMDGKYVTIDSSVKWQVSEPSLYIGFANRNGGFDVASGIIEKRLNDFVSDYIGKISFEQVTKGNIREVLDGFQMSLTKDPGEKFRISNSGISIYSFNIHKIYENYTYP